MGKALKGDSPEVEVVLTRHSQRHAWTRSTILNSSFACSTAGSKVKEYSSSYYSDETIVGLCICTKGLIQVRATTCILVYLYALGL